MIEEKVLAAYQEKIKEAPLRTEFGGGEIPAREPEPVKEPRKEEKNK